jgi:16S rRNA (uracil1498-N3)-methyltransferase
MSNRFFIEPPIDGRLVLLEGPEAHHLLHVMRLAVGEEVVLFDGTGAEFPGQIRRLGRTDVEIEIRARQMVDRELPVPLILGVALPKGDRQKWLVEKLVELGATRLVPLRTARSVAQPVRQAVERLQRTVIEASKQCGRNCLLELADACDWPDFVSGISAGAWRLVAHPAIRQGEEKPAASKPQFPNGTQGESICLAIGPEGGFTEQEVELARSHGWQTLDLGPRLLRIETAALYAAVWAITQI